MTSSIICCDIQPCYVAGFNSDFKEFVQYLEGFDKILYLFNDSDIGVPDTKEDIIYMLKASDASDELIKRIQFRRKVFYYFRDVLDISDKETCVKLLKLLIMRGVDSADKLSANDIKIATNLPGEIIDKLVTGELHFFYDPSLATDLLQFNNSVEVGGFENQCNAEIEVYLDAMNLQYSKNYKFIF